jgi:hypothetical protein
MTKQIRHLEPTNVQRAEWAKAALALFTAQTYAGDEPDTMNPGDLEDAIADLICDLLHFARCHPRLDPSTIHSHALHLFEQEIAAERACHCSDRSWYGTHHDTQCPLSAACNGTSKKTRSTEGENSIPRCLDALLDIKRLAGKSGDHEADPWALLDLIAYEVRAAIAQITPQTKGSRHDNDRHEQKSNDAAPLKMYTVLFAEDVPQYASARIEAADEAHALSLAKSFDTSGLDYECSRDDAVCRRIVHIEEPRGAIVATDIPLDNFSLRRAGDKESLLLDAASDMLEALELCEDVLSELARLDDGTPSVSALHTARDAIAKAKGGPK